MTEPPPFCNTLQGRPVNVAWLPDDPFRTSQTRGCSSLHRGRRPGEDAVRDALFRQITRDRVAPEFRLFLPSPGSWPAPQLRDPLILDRSGVMRRMSTRRFTAPAQACRS